MAEPGSAAVPAYLLGGVTLAHALPGVDSWMVICAAGGAGFFALMSYWIPSIPMRIGYFLLSWLFGVIYAVEEWSPAWLPGPGIKAFLAAFVIVMALTSLVEFFRTGMMPSWLKELARLRLSKRGDADAP